MNSQYAVAVHILSLIGLSPEHARTSEDIAASVGTNPVVVRNIIGLLRRAGLLQTQQGVPGAQLTRSPRDITLLDVYRAVNQAGSVFRLHEQPNPRCRVGGNVQAVLGAVFGEAQQALETHLARVTLADLMVDLSRRAG